MESALERFANHSVRGETSARVHLELRVPSLGVSQRFVAEDGQPVTMSLPNGMILSGRTYSQRDDLDCPSVSGSLPKVCKLDPNKEFLIGRTVAENEGWPPDDPQYELDEIHCSLAFQQDEDDKSNSAVWIVDNCSKLGTFVNRQRVRAKLLQSGDLIQVGSFSWTFNQEEFKSNKTTSRSCWLTPVRHLCGIGLELDGYQIRSFKSKNLSPLSFSIPPGQFWAIRGPSGVGKSTLLKALAGVPGYHESGTLRVFDPNTKRIWDADQHRSDFRALLGYVSQESIIHRKLTPLDAVRFCAQLRGSTADERQALQCMELEQNDLLKLIENLSGGEEKRVRAAAAMFTEPRLLLLDEPDSGLDHQRQHLLMKQLRNLRLQGCTVLVVTHGPDDLLLYCDRVLVLQPDGKAPQLFSPLEFLRRGSNDNSGLLVGESREETTVPSNVLLNDSVSERSCSPRKPQPGALAQFRLLFCREWTLKSAHWVQSLIVPTVVLTSFFAGAIGVAVKASESALTGFLSVLACLWMGASLSSLSIAGERNIFDHERVLFLRIRAYLAAKILSLSLISMIQTAIFLVVLWGVQRLFWGTAATFFEHGAGLFWTLCLIGWNGVGLGLLLSASAGRHRELASFCLPLVMILQLVFSVHVSDPDNARASLPKAYGSFPTRRCHMSPECRRLAREWDERTQTWLCDRCQGLVTRTQDKRPTEERGVVLREVRHQLGVESRRTPHGEAAAIKANSQVPPFLSAWCSYLTFTRYWGHCITEFQ
ncbi:MAG: ATP-binding cassette domain-containing protein [Planctomycetia bacterium]|nr:ATP-binding cassette domain-containing protein [Planctomycetia bacterium]